MPFRQRRLSLTSLIDVIFLLLLFFMLSSTFSQFSEVELGTAGADPAGASESRPVFVRLSRENLRVNTREVTLEALPAVIAPLVEAGEGRAVISTGTNVTAQRLTDLLLALRSVSGLRAEVLAPS